MPDAADFISPQRRDQAFADAGQAQLEGRVFACLDAEPAQGLCRPLADARIGIFLQGGEQSREHLPALEGANQLDGQQAAAPRPVQDVIDRPVTGSAHGQDKDRPQVGLPVALEPLQPFRQPDAAQRRVVVLGTGQPGPQQGHTAQQQRRHGTRHDQLLSHGRGYP